MGGARSPKETEPIKIAVLRGRHEVKLKIKQSEALHGPKVMTAFLPVVILLRFCQTYLFFSVFFYCFMNVT